MTRRTGPVEIKVNQLREGDVFMDLEGVHVVWTAWSDAVVRENEVKCVVRRPDGGSETRIWTPGFKLTVMRRV